jgi:hypothetical protein
MRPWGALVVVVLVLAACGGSDDGASTDAATDTAAATEAAGGDKESYIAAGDEICADAQTEAAALLEEAQALQQQSGTMPRDEFLAQAAGFWEEQIAFAEDFRGQFAELEPPAEDAERHEEFLGSVDDGIEIANEIQQTLADGDPVSDSLSDDYRASVEEGNRLARDYGFQVCGRTEG